MASRDWEARTRLRTQWELRAQIQRDPLGRAHVEERMAAHRNKISMVQEVTRGLYHDGLCGELSPDDIESIVHDELQRFREGGSIWPY